MCVAAEPVRTSVIGAGRPVPVRPPAAVISRPVVAVRTPPPPPRPIEQRQAQAGGHLNQQALVRPVGPAQPAADESGRSSRRSPIQDGFRPFTQPNSRQQPGDGRCRRRSRGFTSSRELRSRRIGLCSRTRIAMRSRQEPQSADFRRRRSRTRPAPAGDASAGAARASGAGAEPATGTAAGAEVQSVAPTAAHAASAAAAQQPSRPSSRQKQEKPEERPLTLTASCGVIGSHEMRVRTRHNDGNAGRSATSPGVVFCSRTACSG